MLKKLKQSKFGLVLYHLSLNPYGAPLRGIARFVQDERLHPAHLRRVNRHHNRVQQDVLAAFEATGEAANDRG